MAGDTNKIQILGPLWKANARILETAGPNSNPALRTLFVANRPRKLGSDWFYVPGTVLALCAVLEVTIQLGEHKYTWTINSTEPMPATPEDLQKALRDGKLALLVLSMDPAQAQAPSQVYTCVAGEIGIPKGGPGDQFYKHLDITPPDPDKRLPGMIAVHGSGVWLPGALKLPWHGAEVASIFQLGPEPRLTIAHDLLNKTEREDLGKAWRGLGACLNPRNPVYAASEGRAPTWVTLDLADPNALPHLTWPVTLPAKIDVQPKRGDLALDPTEVSLILSDRHPSDPKPPTTVAHVPLQRIVIKQDTNQQDTNKWHIEAATETQVQGAKICLLKYHSTENGETFTLSRVGPKRLEFAFDPVEVPRWLRAQQALPTPVFGDPPEDTPPGVLTPVRTAPILWGCTPLPNGWAQAPVPNLTEQIYLDADPTLGPKIHETLKAINQRQVLGAAVFGNRGDLPTGPGNTKSGEQPWSVVITDVASAAGTWTYDPAGKRVAVELKLTDPEVTLDGFFWLAAGRPTVEDALPDLSDWLTGLRSIPLHLVSASSHLYPPVAALTLENDLDFSLRPDAGGHPYAALGAWTRIYKLNAERHEKHTGQAAAPAPLVWQRHPVLPMIQTLPLTQNRQPSNHPSASRQLVPFTTTQNDWTLTLATQPPPTITAAAAWPHVQSLLALIEAWSDREDLGLAALSLPGLLLDPKPTSAIDSVDTLPRQYRYDLPYTDELNALARLPVRPKLGAGGASSENTENSHESAPLTPETFAAHWDQLSRRASLAALDAVDALGDEAGKVMNLVEPYPWPAQAAWDLAKYPGSLDLTQNSQTVKLEAEKALEGISGAFVLQDHHLDLLSAPTDGAFQISAGSMVAHLNKAGASEPEGMRDQRGLIRQRTTQHGPLLTTPVSFVEEAGNTKQYALASTQTAYDLKLNDSTTWRFWFRDLPLAEGVYSRHHEKHAEDINDPEALARKENFLLGYEWRLSADDPNSPPRGASPLVLNGLRFFPLTLEQVALQGNEIDTIALTGRLQLPLPSNQELEELANAVRLTFGRSNGGVVLKEVASAIGKVATSAPLKTQGGEAGTAPRLEWDNVSYNPDQHLVTMTGVRLHFVLLEKTWALPLKGDLSFPLQGNPGSLKLTVSQPDRKPMLGLNEVVVNLDMVSGNHGAVATLEASFGSAERGRPILTALLAVDMFNQTVTPSDVRFMDEPVTIALQSGQEQADAAREHVTLTAESLALSWLGYAHGTELQLLPVMDVLPAANGDTGYAVLTFDLEANPQTGAEGQAWHFTPKSGFVEALLNCRWGESLFDVEAPSPEDIFAPSAGNLTGAYTAKWKGPDQWNETLLLNGILEVRNLISWPKPDSADPLRLPASLPGTDLSHVRHTMRILFNQHVVPGNLLRAGDGPLLFDLGSRQLISESNQKDDYAWEFLAVVEHQLAAIDPENALIGDRRWTVVQEVRLLPQPSFGWFLDALAGWKTKDPTTGIGYFGPALRESLKSAMSKLPSETSVLFVEASAHFWIAPQKIAVDLTPQTSLQFLPGGATLALLSSPQDFRPAASPPAGGPEWTLLTLPFLGRLSRRRAGEEFNPLLDDAIALLQRNDASPAARASAAPMANRGVQQPVMVRSNALDGWAGHSWPRLDVAALEENWLRLQGSQQEAVAKELQSILAASPDSPARLSRNTLMARLFEPKPQPGAAVSAGDGGPAPAESTATPAASVDVKVVPIALNNAEFKNEANKQRHPFHGPGPANHPFGENDAVPAGWQVLEAGYRNEILTAATQSWRARFDALKAGDGGWGLPRFRFPMEKGDKREAKTYGQLYDIPDGNLSWLIYADSRPIHVAIGQEVTLAKGEYVLTCWIVPVQSGDGGIPDRPDNPTPAQLDQLRTEYRTKWRPPDGDSKVSLWLNGVAQGTRDGSQVRYHQWNKAQWRFSVTTAGPVKLGILLEGSSSNWKRNGWLIDNFSLVRLEPDVKPPPKTIDHPVWRPDSLLALASGATVEPLVPGWHALAPRLMSSPLWPFTADQNNQGAVARFAAATLLPTRPEMEMLPVGLAISPYLGLGFQQTPSDPPDLQVVVAELLCQEGARQGLTVARSRVWDWTKMPDKIQQAALDTAAGWARELHQRLYASSPFAVLRLRMIHGNPNDAASSHAAVVTSYAFHLVPGLARPEKLLHQIAPLRAQTDHLRFREGQFGGYSIPDQPQPFELAPPQVTGARPIYLLQDASRPWSWGLSALHFGVRYTEAKKSTIAQGVAGALQDNAIIWWHAPRYHVQFRSITSDDRPAAGLPGKFRARAIQGLLPVVPQPKMPKTLEMGVAPPENTPDSHRKLYRWQPVLPGALRFLVLGARAGAMLALRHQLLRQSVTGDEHQSVMVSGSIPVQHRVPRPVPLPANRADDRTHALQTWASFFEPNSHALVTRAPADEAFFAPAGLSFTITEATWQAVRTAGLGLAENAPLDVLNRPIAGLQALLATLEDKLGQAEGKKALPHFARLAERSPGAGIVEFRFTDKTRHQLQAAGFDKENEWLGQFAWDTVVGKMFSRFTELAKTFKLLDILVNLQSGGKLNSVQAGAFVNAVYELTRLHLAAGRVKLTLHEPAYGEIGRDWTGALRFEVKTEYESNSPDPEPSNRWQIALSAELGDRRLAWKWEPLQETGSSTLDKDVVADAKSPAQALSNWLADRSTGDILLLEARIKPTGSTDDFAQVLRFPLRFVEKDVLSLPLAPAFVHFEDPEYNRLLTTPAAHASVIVTEENTGQIHTVTLAADRKRYNPNSMLYLRYDWDDERTASKATLSLQRVSGEVVEPLRWDGAADSQVISSGALKQIPLASLRLSKKTDSAVETEPFPSVDWRQGDVLQLKLVLDEFKDSPIMLRVAIVQAPVDPTPEAGYALLRASANGHSVECVRFAFAPQPARIELVSPDDLRQEIVRRRAIFQWLDVARPNARLAHVIQKISTNGSTHVPVEAEFRRADVLQ